MSKIRDNYLAELIILLVITVMLMSSCKSNYCPYSCSNEKPIMCCEKDTNHPLWECEGELVYKHSELITN